MTCRKPKFKVGQVVCVMGSKLLRSFVPDYFRISGVKPYGRTWQYRVSDHDMRGPWIAQKQLRALYAPERGRWPAKARICSG